MNSKNKKIEDSFDKFIISSDLKEILSAFNQLCDLVDLNPSENSSSFYSKLQYKLKSYWKAETLFTNLDKKVFQKEYRKQTACSNIKALVIGSGPCGLRCAIELALLGARVVVIDKRENFSRNNVLHLWPFVINDLKALGAKIFFGMFCAGSIDHISIRRLQCILFKVALLFGVQFFVGVNFQSLILPTKNGNGDVTAEGDVENASFATGKSGWRAKVTPADNIISNYEFNTIVGADGKTNILGFPRKELRCRLAIAITANFVNKNTFEEAQAEEISGVAFVFNQQFFKDIYSKTGIDLENIVYYKDETHYYVMTAKKHSLLSKGVIKQDAEDPEMLLHPNNINYDALQSYAKEVANVVTNYKIADLEFSKNHRGEPDVAVFDFTHMFAAENASKIMETNGYFLLQMLVGDSLLEPFWPTGSGCALGFLSSLDAAWLVRRIGMITNALEQDKISHFQQKTLILQAIAERESIYQRLSQTTPSNMPPNFNTYTLNPRTRYVQCKTNFIEIPQILHLYDTDDKSKKLMSFKNDYIAVTSNCDLKNKQNPIGGWNSTKLMGLNLSMNNSLKDASINTSYISTTSMKGEYMLRWFQIRLDRYFNFKLFKVDDLSKSWVSGVAFLCLIHLYSPDSIHLSSINDDDTVKNLDTAFTLFEKKFHITNSVDASSIENVDSLTIFNYLEKIYETLRVLNPNRLSEEIYEHRSVNVRKMKRHCTPRVANDKKYEFQMFTPTRPTRRSSGNRFGCDDIEKGIIELRKEEILRLYTSSYKEPLVARKAVNGASDKVDRALQVNAIGKQRDWRNKANDKYPSKLSEKYRMAGQICHFCKTRIFQKKHDSFENYVFHKYCFRCQYCSKDLNSQQFKLLKLNHVSEGKFYCLRHFEKLSNISFIRENNVSNTLRDLVLKEDKKLQKLTSRENLKVDMKYSHDRQLKSRKPKHGLQHFGCVVPQNQVSSLPVYNLFGHSYTISEADIEARVEKNLLSLRRVNDESDEDYDGSVDEASGKLLSLDVVEPLDENQYSWSLCFKRGDLEYALKKCQVIRKNRLIYKKYKSKDESTSDESEINMLVHDICRTSDEDLLADAAAFDGPGSSEMSRRTPDTFPPADDDSIPQTDPQGNDGTEAAIWNAVDLPAANVTTNGSLVTTTTTTTTDDRAEPVKAAMDPSNTDRNPETTTVTNMIDGAATETSKADNSRNLRQMAKLKFCTEPPKPVSINPREFISQINHNKMVLIDTPCYLEVADYLPSLTDIFVTVTNQYAEMCAEIVVLEKSILSASIMSIDDRNCRHGNLHHDRATSKSINDESSLVVNNSLSNDHTNIAAPTITIDDHPPGSVPPHHQSSSSNVASRRTTTNKAAAPPTTPQNPQQHHHHVFNDVVVNDDIKDIDSLSVNTEEDCSMTHLDMVSDTEGGRLGRLAPLTPSTASPPAAPIIARPLQKATLDSELEISMGRFSMGDDDDGDGATGVGGKTASSSCNNSLNSLPMSSLASSPSFAPSAPSGVSASSESDGRKCDIADENKCRSQRRRLPMSEGKTDGIVDHCPRNKDSTKFFPNFLNKNYRKKMPPGDLKCSNDLAIFGGNVSLKGVIPPMDSSAFCNTVTPPHDIELDDNRVKCVQVNAQFPSAIDSAMPLKDIDNISTKFRRVNDIHRQLECIEDKLNELNAFTDNSRPAANVHHHSSSISKTNHSKSPEIFHNEEQVSVTDDSTAASAHIISDDRGGNGVGGGGGGGDGRFVMGFIL